jgi:hypothetical protein
LPSYSGLKSNHQEAGGNKGHPLLAGFLLGLLFSPKGSMFPQNVNGLTPDFTSLFIITIVRTSDSKKVFKYLSVSRQVNSLFQTEFSKECDLELPPSTSSIFLFP